MKPLIVANWKANPISSVEAKKLFNKVKSTGAIICPPFVYLFILKANGAQDIEVSPAMLKNMGVEYVILGHSERRINLNETDEMINKKIEGALAAGLKPILCVDSVAQARGVDKKIILAFEPISAIGTEKPFDIQKAKKMRESLVQFKTVLYGGSVNSKNAKDYIKEAGFQGLLVGKASLDAKEFISIIESVI
ncbi:MAG: triose-phosphate isomerase [Patescibacteria group bacterium]